MRFALFNFLGKGKECSHLNKCWFWPQNLWRIALWIHCSIWYNVHFSSLNLVSITGDESNCMTASQLDWQDIKDLEQVISKRKSTRNLQLTRRAGGSKGSDSANDLISEIVVMKRLKHENVVKLHEVLLCWILENIFQHRPDFKLLLGAHCIDPSVILFCRPITLDSTDPHILVFVSDSMPISANNSVPCPCSIFHSAADLWTLASDAMQNWAASSQHWQEFHRIALSSLYARCWQKSRRAAHARSM